MAGHSKWAQIKRKKAVTDAARSKVFGKFARLIAVESKRCDGDISAPSLRTIIERAKAENMPKENIERAVAKGVSQGGVAMERIVYETYGPGGVALLIDTLTDNRNRTAQEIKFLLSESGCELATPGSALWAFVKTDGEYAATTTIPLTEHEMEVLASLVNVIEEHDDVHAVYTNVQE